MGGSAGLQGHGADPDREDRLDRTRQYAKRSALAYQGQGSGQQAGERGDLYALFKIVIPAQSNEQIRTLWTQLAEQAAFDPRAEWSH